MEKITKFSTYILFFLFLLFTPVTVKAETETVRVGYFDYEGFLELESNGNYYGYGYEYLDEISSYTGWKYEFIYGTWEECLERLADGKIDLLCTAQYSEEREKLYDYCKYEVGTEYAMLMVTEENDSVFYNDYASFDGLKVGFMEKSYQNDLFEQYAREHCFSYEPVWFASSGEMSAAMEKGEIDALVTGSLQKTYHEKAVAKFSPQPFYFITTKGNTELIKNLDQAMEEIQTSVVDYNQKLYSKYYGETSFTRLAFTREEADYIRRNPVLKVAYNYDMHPVEYEEEENGEFCGINAGILNLISERSGIRFEGVPYRRESEALQMLLDHEVDLICSYPETYMQDKREYGLVFTKPYFSVPFTLSVVNGMSPDEVRTIAVPENNQLVIRYTQELYPDKKVVAFQNTEACLNAVYRENADAVFENVYVLDQYDHNKRYTFMEPVESERKTIPVCMVLRDDQDPALRSLLNKLITRLETGQVNDVVIQNTMEGPSLKLNTVWKRFLFPVVGTAFFIIFLIVLRSKRQIEKYAFVDPLTGHDNRTRFLLSAERLLKNRGYQGHTVVSLDIDKFKLINDMHGYETGNRILKEISNRLGQELGNGELFCRESGDHFLLLLRDGEENPIARRLPALIRSLSGLPASRKEEFWFTISCGAYCFQQGDDDIHRAIGWASLAREKSKKHRSDWITFYDDSMRKEATREREIENQMESALAGGEFEVYYQPKLRLVDEVTVGAEALVRWKKKSGEMIFPDVFIPVFESNGFIIQLDLYVFEQVCRQLRRWIDGGIEPCPISVNLSRMHLSNREFYRQYLEIMNRYDILPKYIEIELTESIIFENRSQIVTLLNQFKLAGLMVSIDDFGSGYSSLNIMKDLQFDYLKLDKEFFNTAADTKRGKNVIRSMIYMADQLNMDVVAEGVETREQVEFLKSIHCGLVQGYYYSRPVPVDQFQEFLLQSREKEV